MISLSDRKWQSFEIGDLFNVSGTTTTHPSVLKEKGNIPRITCQAVNNGLEGFYSNTPTENGGVLTVDSATDGAVNYQGYDFIATDHVEKISRKDGERIDRLSGIFLVWAVKSAIGNKYNYGYKFSQNRIRKQTILLPVTETGEPDYDFMRSFVAERESSKRKEYVEYAARQLAQIERERVDNEAIEWRVFYLSDLFSIQRGKRLKNDDHKSGDIPYVSSSATNNGVDDYVSNVEKVRIFDNCLTLANSGSVGSTFYHSYHFVASDHVTSLKQAGMDKYCYLFITTLISRLSEKYNFNREINDPRIRREKILLPVKNNEPHYTYMSNCVRNTLADKYTEYLNYAQKINY